VALLCNIGEGGFCEVFEGKWFGAPVAVKRLRLTGHPQRDALLARAFEHEIGLHHSLVRD
jgi:serine/threonine protein kinase